MANISLLPTEDQEQMVLVRWLNLHRIPHFHTNNEMWTTSIKQKHRASAMGVVPGIPDLFVFIPRNDHPIQDMVLDGKKVKASVNITEYFLPLGIELKRKKGGRVSEPQKRWLDILNLASIDSRVCYGADEAIEFINSHRSKGVVADDDQSTF